MWESISDVFVLILLIGYIVSLIEVVGSYIISTLCFGDYSKFYLITSIFVPLLSYMFAWAIFSSAKELYDEKRKNETQIDESFFGWILHGFKTIDQWHNKK